MIFYLVLTLLTAIILLLSAKQDIQERMIYTFPIIVLHLIWSVYLWQSMEWSGDYLAIFWMIHLIIYLILNRGEIWGGGDSDMLMLFGDICLFSSSVISGYAAVMKECIYLVIGLIISIVIWHIENKVKHKVLKTSEEIAVIPGIAAVMIALMIKGICWRLM